MNNDTSANPPPLDREALVQNLQKLASLPNSFMECVNNPAQWQFHTQVRESAKNALQLLDDYDTVLRNLAMALSAGGHNSDGLIDPKVADAKIRWGIDELVSVERQRAAAKVAPAADAGLPAVSLSEPAASEDPETEERPLPLQRIAELIVQEYAGAADDYTISIGGWKEVSYSPVPEFYAFVGVPMRDWRWYVRPPALPGA